MKHRKQTCVNFCIAIFFVMRQLVGSQNGLNEAEQKYSGAEPIVIIEQEADQLWNSSLSNSSYSGKKYVISDGNASYNAYNKSRLWNEAKYPANISSQQSNIGDAKLNSTISTNDTISNSDTQNYNSNVSLLNQLKVKNDAVELPITRSATPQVSKADAKESNTKSVEITNTSDSTPHAKHIYPNTSLGENLPAFRANISVHASDGIDTKSLGKLVNKYDMNATRDPVYNHSQSMASHLQNYEIPASKLGLDEVAQKGLEHYKDDNTVKSNFGYLDTNPSPDASNGVNIPRLSSFFTFPRRDEMKAPNVSTLPKVDLFESYKNFPPMDKNQVQNASTSYFSKQQSVLESVHAKHFTAAKTSSQGYITPLVLKKLVQNLKLNILNVWSYNQYIKTPADVMLDQGLINRAKLKLSSGKRLRNLFMRGIKGMDIKIAFISSSLSNKLSKVYNKKYWFYPQALLHWWGKMITPVTGSKMTQEKVQIPHVKADYFARCLKNHLHYPEKVNLLLWEMAEFDSRPDGKAIPINEKYHETFLRSALGYRSHPEVIMIDFYRGHKSNKSTYCRNLNEIVESKLASRYDCTLLSWSKSICPYLVDDEEGFSYSYLFSEDKVRPSIIGHAQMAYILIDYLRDEFLNFLQHYQPISDLSNLPNPLFSSVHKTLCYTSLKSAGNPVSANNRDLSVRFIQQKDIENGAQRSLINKNIINKHIKPVILRFNIPGRPGESSHATIGILPYFSKPLLTVARVDDQPFIRINYRKLGKGKILELQPNTELSSGNHMVRFWSLDKTFDVLAFTVDQRHNSLRYS